MDEQQKILVVGDQGCAESVFGPGNESRHQITYCTKDDYAVVSGKQNGSCFDWILINGAELARGKADLLRSLRAMGPFDSANYRPYPQAPQMRVHHSCGVEWSDNGTLILRCCRQSADGGIDRESASQVNVPDSAFVFEYHAPVKKTG